MTAGKSDSHLKEIWRYYDRTESRIGYSVLLGGTKHFGWYEKGQSKWRFSPAMRRMENVLGEKLDLPAGSEVLDAGCGVGDVARAMASRFGLRVTGIDILDFNLAEAIARSDKLGLRERTRFQWGDYHDLEFADESFDGVYTMETFVHSAEPEKALSEFFRVLRPGGRLVMFEYSRTPEDQLSPEANRAFEQVCELGAMPAWHELNHGDLEVLLAKTGFTVETVADVTEKMLPMLHAFAIIGRAPYFALRKLGHVEKAVNAMSGVETYRYREAWRYNIYTAVKPGE
ncbi:MAG TPA: methyltransferase domain-containing protein [Actinocrinis sp.]|uniref:class I SAM-dependent methyltransferase n=1 Tax=Actinocrinis sp. TaxID=1920516 RepID=UPI002DDD8423|nr:methyltransferase domain-containing protein [Actinocrinis sp.]HEV2344808.1 methyltransferase domain-containing protein [Actinocrinis sp.]